MGNSLFTWLSLVVSFMASIVLSFFPLDVLDGIWDLIESVSEGFLTYSCGGGRVVQRCCVNFQCRGVLLIWIIVGQGPIALAVGAGGGCLDIFSLIYHFSFLSLSLWETARYRLKYCLKGPLSPKQPTNLPTLAPPRLKLWPEYFSPGLPTVAKQCFSLRTKPGCVRPDTDLSGEI